jgi:hypothetical protein
MGLKTLNKILKYYNESARGKISYDITDISDGGTKVIIRISS